MKTKKCSNPNCLDPIKPISEFCKNKDRKDRLQGYCKKCVKEYNKQYRAVNKVKISNQHKDFYKLNKEEILKYHKEYQDNNKEKLSIQGKEKYIKNKEEILNHNKKYRDKNKDKINKYFVDHREIDVNFKITGNLRNRLNVALSGNTKSLSTMFLIGCEINYLMYYLQSQFTKGMSWDNYGDWHIDHIKPCASFDLSKPNQQKICFNYTNLQPLWAIDNMRKGNKIIP